MGFVQQPDAESSLVPPARLEVEHVKGNLIKDLEKSPEPSGANSGAISAAAIAPDPQTAKANFQNWMAESESEP